MLNKSVLADVAPAMAGDYKSALEEINSEAQFNSAVIWLLEWLPQALVVAFLVLTQGVMLALAVKALFDGQ